MYRACSTLEARAPTCGVITYDPATTPDLVVRSFFERMEERRWNAAEALVAPDAVIGFSETGERFRGDHFVAMNRADPEGWTITVVEVLATRDRVAAQVRVELPPETFWCAGFSTVESGRIVEGPEHWVTEGHAEPPQWRRPFTLTP